MKPEVSKKSEWWIPKERYYELKHFCLQYDLWKKAYERIDIQANDPSKVIVAKTEHFDPIQAAVESKEKWYEKMHMVDWACDYATSYAFSIKKPEEAKLLKEAVTKGYSFEKMEARYSTFPVSRDVYYESYRRFFWILDKVRD